MRVVIDRVSLETWKLDKPNYTCINHAMRIHPAPRTLRAGSRDTYLLRSSRRGGVGVSVSWASDPRIRQKLVNLCEVEHLSLSFATPSKGRLVTIDRDRKLPDQAYCLTVRPDGMQLTVNSASGLHYGLQTLAQILSRHRRRIPCVTIRDQPSFAQRGVMLDISRCKVPTLDTLFTLIDQLALLKFNQLQLYIEHTFAFDGHETVWKDSSPLTSADLLRIQAYCHDRFIALVPNLNSFGHFERWLRHPAYQHLAECPEGFIHPLTGEQIPWGSTLTPGRPALNLINDLYDQFLPLHDSTLFNIGGDEPWELGRGRSRRRCERLGRLGVYTDFIGQINKRVRKHNKTVMVWADVIIEHPEVLGDLPENATAMLWGYEASHPFARECRAVNAAGVPYYVCPGTGTWNSIVGRFDNMRRNIRQAAHHGQRHGANGLLITDWGDHGHHQYLPFSFPGFIVAAAHAWSGRTPSDDDIRRGLMDVFKLSSKAAGILLSMGGLDAASEVRCRNSTVFNHGLFPGRLGEDVALSMTPGRARFLDNRLTALRERASELDDDLIRQELTTAAAFAAHGIRRIRRKQSAIGGPSQLRAELTALIEQHRTCWLGRNRPGGLGESCSHLHSSLAQIR